MKGSVGSYKAAGKRKGTTVTRYYYVVNLGSVDGTDPTTGEVVKKRKQERRRGFESGKAARDAMNKRIVELTEARENGEDTARREYTVGEWLDSWIARVSATGNIKPSTVVSYRSHIETHLKPQLGSVKLRALRPMDVDEMLVNIQKPRQAPEVRSKGQHINARHTGPATATRVRATLRAALKDALRNRLVVSNAAAESAMPKSQRPQINPWTEAELTKFRRAVAQEDDADLFDFLAYTGMRRGEALGLRWADIDGDVARVRQQVTENPGNSSGPACEVCGSHHGAVAFGTPKSRAGVREVDLPPLAMAAVEKRRKRRLSEKVAAGPVWSDHDLVFAQADGNPLVPSSVTSLFADLIAKAGVRKVRVHDLRHGYAMLMLAAGVPIEVLSMMMGHSSLAITLANYGHMVPEKRRDYTRHAFRNHAPIGDHEVTTGTDSATVTSIETAKKVR